MALGVGALLLPVAGLGTEVPRADLRDFSCQRAMDPANRSIAADVVMRPVSLTQHMAVRVDLLVSRGPGAAVKSLRAGDLGQWIHPENPTLGQLPGDVWTLQKSVLALRAPATYRLRVRFRWEGANQAILATATRYSPRCVEPELRPDLAVRSITVASAPGHSDTLYTARIVNAGNSAAGPFDVLFAPRDGSAGATQTVSSLGAHSWLTATFTGSACNASAPPTITADPAGQVDDLNRANNALTATCPS
ncbi:MAG TPA: CARDB domain-containing protein [Solirubrobacteraceae bacterium]